MEFRIADMFIDILSKLTGQEQKAVKMTAFDLQLNLSSPSLRFSKLDNFVSSIRMLKQILINTLSMQTDC